MKNKYFLLLLFSLFWTSCAAQIKSPDRQIDTGLGVEESTENQEAQSAIQSLQQSQQQEQRRQLERQITDPLTGS